MATKNLARTAIEGGRTTRFKEKVAEREAVFRRENREFTAVEPDEDDPNPLLRPKSKRGHQTDKLRAIWRMLDKLHGLSWAKVGALITERYDARTLAGQHILGHIKDMISMSLDDVNVRFGRYYVDGLNIFRKYPKSARSTYVPEVTLTGRQVGAIDVWLDGRSVRHIGTKMYWALPSEPVRLADWRASGNRTIWFTRTRVEEHRRLYLPPRVSWRQDKPLTAKDITFLESLPPHIQLQIKEPRVL